MAKTTFSLLLRLLLKVFLILFLILFTLKKDHIGQAFEELCKKTNRSLNNLPPITKVETHTRKEGLIKIYG